MSTVVDDYEIRSVLAIVSSAEQTPKEEFEYSSCGVDVYRICVNTPLTL